MHSLCATRNLEARASRGTEILRSPPRCIRRVGIGRRPARSHRAGRRNCSAGVSERRSADGLKQGADIADALWEWGNGCCGPAVPAFVKLQRSIVKRWDTITAAAEHQLSNGLVESMNTKIRLITRIAFGFKRADHRRPPPPQAAPRPVSACSTAVFA